MNFVQKALLATAIAGVAALSSAQAETVLKVGHSAQPTFHMHKAWLKFAELVNEGSKGEIKVEVYPADQMGSSLEQLEYTQEGTLDMSSEAMSLLSTWDKAFGVTEMPYVFTSREQALTVLNEGSFGKFLSDKMADIGLKNLGVTENGFRQITNNVHSVTKPSDLKGLKIRTMQVDSHIIAYKQFGANPAPMAFGEVYSALQQGVVDGQDNPLSQIATSRFYEVQKFLTMANIVFSADVVVMNKAKFDALSPEHQKLIEDSMKKALAYQQEIIKAEEKDYISFFRKNGLTVDELTPEQVAVFKAEVEKVRPEMVKAVGQENWDTLNKAIAEYNASHK